MKSILFISLLLMSQITMANQDQDDLPSVGDIIGNIMEGDNSFKSYHAASQIEAGTCVNGSFEQFNTSVDKKSFYQAWELNCLVLNNSKLCEGIAKHDKLICNEPAKTAWYSNIWEKTKACGSGIKKSWEDYIHFIKQIGHYISNNEGMRDKVNESVSKAYTSMRSYLSMEVVKYQDKYHVSKSKAFFAVTGNMLRKFTNGLNLMIAKAAPKVGCYNYKAKTRVICQVLAEFFAEPIIMFKFIKLGPKALKGTRVARFFNFHSVNAARKTATVAEKGKDVVQSTLKAMKKSSNKLDFIPKEEKLGISILKRKELAESVQKHSDIFNDVFPNKAAREELDDYLAIAGDEDGKQLAQIFKILNEDKAKMSKKEYDDFIQDIRNSIKRKCGN